MMKPIQPQRKATEMGNLKVQQAVTKVLSNENSESFKSSMPQVMTALSELALFKPTLKLDMQTQALWAEQLASSYSLRFVLLAIEQLKHSPVQWVNFGDIATEARRLKAVSGDSYAPHSDPKRMTFTELDNAVRNRNSKAIEYSKVQQMKKLDSIPKSQQ